MSTSDEEIALVPNVYAAINAHDIGLIRGLLADDCVRHFPAGSSPIAGEHVGRDAVLGSYEYVIELTGGDHRLELGNVLANDSIAASYHRETARRARDSARLDTEMLVRWRVDDGRVVGIWDYAHDVPALNAFLT